MKADNLIKKAVILAAGEGQRLRPFTASKPKPMISIAGKPILQYVVEALAQNGVREITMVVGYKKEAIFDFFGSGEDFGVEIEYTIQPQQLGTGHALRQTKGKIRGEFLVLSGDNIIEPKTISKLVHIPPHAILLKRQEEISKYGIATVDDGNLTGLLEKPEKPLTDLVNTGIYSFTEEVFNFLDEELDLPGIIQNMLSSSKKIRAIETPGIWLDAVYPWDILRLNDLVLSRLSPRQSGTIERGVVIKGPVSIGKGTVIRANSYIVGPVIIGEGCEIGPSVSIFPSTEIGSHSVIFPYSEIRNSVLGEGVKVGTGSTIRDSIIDRYSQLGAHFSTISGEARIEIEGEHHQVTIGAMIGEHCRIGDGVALAPGVIIGNKVRIGVLKSVDKNIPDETWVM